MSATEIEGADPRRYAHLTTQRLEDPGAVARAAAARIRHRGARSGAQNFIIAADHLGIANL